MSVEHANPVVLYAPDPEGRKFFVSPLGPEENLAIATIRWQDYYRRFIEPGHVSKTAMGEYIALIESDGGLHAPEGARMSGLYLQDETGNQELVGFQTWGISSYPSHPDTDRLLKDYAEPGKNNTTPAYIESRCIREAEQGFGTVLRHAGAVLMQSSNFTAVGHNVLAVDWVDHVDEVNALQPARILRSNAQLILPIKDALNPYALHRTEVWVGLTTLRGYVEERRPWLANFELVEHP